MEVGEIAGKIGRLFKRGKGEKPASPVLSSSAPGSLKTPEPNTHQTDQRKAEEMPLEPLLQKHRDIIENFAKTHDLKPTTEWGQFSLKKEFAPGCTAEVISVRGNGQGFIQIDVYRAGPDGFLKLANDGILKPINLDGTGDDVMLINRDVKDQSIGCLIVIDTRKSSKAT